jgi:hypothetical protein
MEDHRHTDEDIIKELRALARSFEEYRTQTQPMLDAWNAANKTGSFIMYLSKIILSIGVIMGVIFGATHIPK